MPAADEDIRIAAENLLQSSQHQQNVQSPAALEICKRLYFFVYIV